MSARSVSVIVPSYNYAWALEGCVRSVLDQSGVEVRVLVVDDCSPDDTSAVGASLAARDPRVTLHRNKHNLGLIGTVNVGLDWADGEYIVVLSADDLLTPGSLQRAVTVMERSPRVGLVYGHAPYWHEGAPQPSMSGRWRSTKVWRGTDWVRLRCRKAHNCISSPEVVVRASAHHRAGAYDPRCHHASDLNMWLRVAAVADVAHVRGLPQAIYRVHADSMLRSAHGPMIDLFERRKAFDCFFDQVHGLDDASQLRAMAGRALARQALWRASRAIDRNLLHGTDALPVDELVAFAQDVCPTARSLPEWRGLQLRRRLGAGRSGWFPLFLATGVAHRLHGEVHRVRWLHTGV